MLFQMIKNPNISLLLKLDKVLCFQYKKARILTNIKGKTNS